MFADPTTVPSITITFDDNNPLSGATTVASAMVLNKVEASGRKAVYRPTTSVLTTSQLADLSLTVNHQPTKAGRLRSQFRVDASAVSAVDGSMKSCSFNLTIDKHKDQSAADLLSLQFCACLFQKLLFGASGSNAAITTANYSQLLNGES
jgi:hypothetical protein